MTQEQDGVHVAITKEMFESMRYALECADKYHALKPLLTELTTVNSSKELLDVALRLQQMMKENR